MSTQDAVKDAVEPAIEAAPASAPESSGDTPSYVDRNEDVIDLRTIVVEIRRKWWLVLAFLVLGVWSGVTTIQNHQSAHRAVMLVAPAEIQERVEGQSRTIAGLAGITLGTQKTNDVFQRMKIIASTLKLAKKLDEKHDLMMVVYGGAWDAERNSWKRPSGDQFEWDQKVKAFFRQPLWSAPTIEDLAGYVGGGFQIEAIDESDFNRISFAHADAEMALWMLKIVFAEISEFIHQQEVAAQAKRRKFLEARLSNTQIVDFRNALMSLLANVTRKEMMLEGGSSSEIVVLDPPYISKYKTSPTILKTMGVRVFGALALSIVLIVLWTLYRVE